MGEPFTDPTRSPGAIDVSSYAAGDSGERELLHPSTWIKKDYVVEKREFNKFQDDEVPTVAKRRTVKNSKSMPIRHQKNGMCWEEQEFEISTYVTRHFIRKRWVEYWAVNKTLEIYNEFVNDVNKAAGDLLNSFGDNVRDGSRVGLNQPSWTPPGKAGATAAVLGSGGALQTLGGTMATAAGTGIPIAEGTGVVGTAVIATADASAAVVGATGTVLSATGTAVTFAAQVVVPAAVISGVAVAAFVGTAEIMKQEDAEKISEGWELVGTYDAPEELERMAIAVERTPPKPCAPPPEEEHFTTPFPGPFNAVNWWSWMLQQWWVLVATVVLVALLVIGGVFLRGGFSAAPGERPVSGGAAPPAGAPVVSDLRKVFVTPVTTWSITAKDPAGGALKYTWTLTPDVASEACGTPVAKWTQSGTSVAWSHSSEPPDRCAHASPDHAVTMTVVVTNQQGQSVTCSIKGTESADVPNPSCR